MEERKFIRLKKEEFGIKEYIKRNLGKGKISNLDIEYTPVGEKIIISTSKPGLVIGRRGEKIQELTEVLKRRFKLENPHIEISEIEKPLFDSQIVADEIALALERMGNLRFKVIAYRKLQEIMREGALGCELRLSGKLPSERARSWRFAEGYLKKAGEPSKEIDRAQATALTKTGIIGIKVAIMPPEARIYDRIDIDQAMKDQINRDVVEEVEEIGPVGKKSKKKKKVRKKVDKSKKDIDNPERDNKVESKSESSPEPVGDTKTEVIKESPDIKPEEDGTAMKIEEEIEEGVSEEDKKAVEEVEKEEKNIKEEDTKVSTASEDDVRHEEEEEK